MLYIVFVSIGFECQPECNISLLRSVVVFFSLSQFPSKNLMIRSTKRCFDPVFHSGGELRRHSKETRSFKVFEVKVLRKISGRKSAEIMGCLVWYVLINILEEAETFTCIQVSQSED